MKAVIDIGNTTIAIGLTNDGLTIDKVYRLNTEKTVLMMNTVYY